MDIRQLHRTCMQRGRHGAWHACTPCIRGRCGARHACTCKHAFVGGMAHGMHAHLCMHAWEAWRTACMHMYGVGEQGMDD